MLDDLRGELMKSLLRTVLESKELCALLSAKDESTLSDNIIHNPLCVA